MGPPLWGLVFFYADFPALKRWAPIPRASGASNPDPTELMRHLPAISMVPLLDKCVTAHSWFYVLGDVGDRRERIQKWTLVEVEAKPSVPIQRVDSSLFINLEWAKDTSAGLVRCDPGAARRIPGGVCGATHFLLARFCYDKDDCSSCRRAGISPTRVRVHQRPGPSQKEKLQCL